MWQLYPGAGGMSLYHFPSDLEAYHYQGSLGDPRCSECGHCLASHSESQQGTKTTALEIGPSSHKLFFWVIFGWECKATVTTTRCHWKFFSSNMTTDHLYVLLVQKDMHANSSTAIVGATGFVADLSLCSTGPRVQLKSFGQHSMGVNGLTGTPDITPRAFSANSKSQLQITQLKEAFLIESLIAVQIYCVDLTCWQMMGVPQMFTQQIQLSQYVTGFRRAHDVVVSWSPSQS